MKRVLAFGLLVLLSCSGVEEEQLKPRITTVFASFKSEQDTQWVFVDTIYDLDKPVEDTINAGLSGATVMLVGPDTVLFSEAQDRPGRYFARVQILPETTYTLFVQSPLGDSYTLSSRSPKAFEMLLPSNGDSIAPDSLWITWTDPGNPEYGLRIFLLDSTAQDTEQSDFGREIFFPLYPNGDTSTQQVPAALFWLMGAFNTDYLLQAMAYDTVNTGRDDYHDFTVFWTSSCTVFIKE